MEDEKDKNIISYYSNRRGGSHNAQPITPSMDTIIPKNKIKINMDEVE